MFNSYEFSKNPFDGQSFEDYILNIAKDYFRAGVVVNGVLYTRSKEGSVQDHNITHFPSDFDDDEFFDLFDQITAGIRIPMMEQARIAAQVGGIINNDSRLTRVTICSSLKQFHRVRLPEALVTVPDKKLTAIVLVERKDVVEDVPCNVKIVNSIVPFVPESPEVVVVRVTPERFGISTRRRYTESYVVDSSEIHKAISPFLEDFELRNCMFINRQQLYTKINKERRDILVYTDVNPQRNHINHRLALYLKETKRYPRFTVGDRVRHVFSGYGDDIIPTPRSRMMTWIKVRWAIQQPVIDKDELQQ